MKFLSITLASIALALTILATNTPQQKPDKKIVFYDSTALTVRGHSVMYNDDDVINLAETKKIYGSLMNAKGKEMQDVSLEIMQSEIETHLVFNLAAKKEKEITLVLIDEEGFDIVGNRKLALNTGNNYRALNVSQLEIGEYVMLLTDKEGQEKKAKFKVIE